MTAPSPFGAAAAPAPPAPAAAYAPPAPAPAAAPPAPPAAAPPAPPAAAAAPAPPAPAPAPAAVAPPAPPAAAPAPAAPPAAATPFQAAAAPASAPVGAPPVTGAAPNLGFGGGDPFSSPSGISGEKITQFEGELLMVRPTEVIPEMKTQRGIAKNVVRCNTVALSGPRAGEVIKDMLVFQTALKRELATVLASPQPAILGRLGKSRDKNDGNDPAWIFIPYSDEDYAYAKYWQQQNPAFFA